MSPSSTSTNTSTSTMELEHLILNDLNTQNGEMPQHTLTWDDTTKQKIKTVQILQSSNITCIPAKAFKGCLTLELVNIEKNDGDGDGGRDGDGSDGGSSSNLTAIGRGAFLSCKSLESITFPPTVTTIGDFAFRNCQSLKSIVIPKGVMTIKAGTFCGCKSLQSVQIPNNMKRIGRYAFAGCRSLRSVHIPTGVTTIAECAFRECLQLQSICIPDSVINIGIYAFWSCKSLQSIHVPNTESNIGERDFRRCVQLHQRLTDGLNYHPDIETWLHQRFNGLPIHHACYYANDTQTAVDHLSTLVLGNHQALATIDAMGMTSLHILCCNPFISIEMVRVIVEKKEEASILLAQADVTGSTPLQLFLRCKGFRLLGDEEQEQEQEKLMPSSIYDLLEMGISGEDLSILFALNNNDNRQIELSLRQDKRTGLFSFMSAATLPTCGLDVVYTLAMNDFSIIL